MDGKTFSVTLFCLLCFLTACNTPEQPSSIDLPSKVETPEQEIFLTVLGIAQDAGFPQAACRKDCCKAVWQDNSLRKRVSCLGLVDQLDTKSWLFDATPDFKDQLQDLERFAPLQGIFLTHAHIGHYTGLIHLGREVMGANKVPVYAMPKMKTFLETNGPWSQLVALENIDIKPLKADSIAKISNHLAVLPLQVPHRDEFSETVGYLINGPKKKALFIPDIDKWQLWDKDIKALIQTVDYAFLDGSFFQNGEIPGRDMSQIPHPFMEESMRLLEVLSVKDKSKVYFIHFNHTNPVLQKESAARKEVEQAGFKIADEGMHFAL